MDPMSVQRLIDRAVTELKKTRYGYANPPTGHMKASLELLAQARKGLDPAYINPFRHAKVLSLERTDQGVDVRFAQHAPIEAMGAATVTHASTTSGWPLGGVVQYRLLEGDHAGEEVYHAEDVTPVVGVGEHVEAGSVVARVGRQGWTESGFIRPGTHEPCSTDTSGRATTPGKAFARWLRQLGFVTKEDPGPGSSHGCK